MPYLDTYVRSPLVGENRFGSIMAGAVGRAGEVADLRDEAQHLLDYVNRNLWDDDSAFYYDRRPDGSLSPVKSIGAYWALLADAVPPARLEPFLAHLRNPAEFARPDRVPSLSADDPHYRPDGGYWLGGCGRPPTIWCRVGCAGPATASWPTRSPSPT
jgi:hypothetical protein